MCRTFDDALRKAWHGREQSELLRTVAAVRPDGGRSWALGSRTLRPLNLLDIERLGMLGNSCADWSRIQVTPDFDPRRIRFTTLLGDIVLGRFSGSVRIGGTELPTGIYYSTVADCAIGDDVLIRDVHLLTNHAVSPGAVLCNCGSITCDGPTTFGNGTVLPLGPETGGRAVALFAEIDLALATILAEHRGDRHLQQAYADFVRDYLDRVRCSRGIIERGAVVRDTPRLHNVYLGPAARIENATFVTNATLLSNPDEPTEVLRGAGVADAVLQWGARVDTFAVAQRSALLEHCHAELHAKITESLIGANTGIGKGEVTCSLVGPFVGFHHQALLIAALWPAGKGNVASGAQVGSNHTGKAPDQELLAGEGVFFGLGVTVKYPADFRQAPYSLIACGTQLLPQRVTFPFSLINRPSVQPPEVPPAYNEIFPAWVLTENFCGLKRNESKFRRRDQARRSHSEVEVLRPDTVELMRKACQRLETVAPREVYTDRDIEGLGKNFLLEVTRQKAVAGYRLFLRYFALLGLKEKVQSLVAACRRQDVPHVLGRPGKQPRWEYQRRLLLDELRLRDIAAGLRELPDLLDEIARLVQASKSRDDDRGQRVIDDYATCHPTAAADVLVQETWQETRRLQAETHDLLRALEGGGGGFPTWSFGGSPVGVSP